MIGGGEGEGEVGRWTVIVTFDEWLGRCDGWSIAIVPIWHEVNAHSEVKREQ
jgi:hypothetical protein